MAEILESGVLRTPNKLIHERARLLILTLLATKPDEGMSFTEIRDELELTAGNLSMHLKMLTDAAYVREEKKFVARRPLTMLYITPEGLQALEHYLADMEKIIKSIKGVK